MDGDIVGVVLIVLALAGVAGVIYAQVSRSQQLLRRWASENQYQLEDAEVRLLRRGPFWWSGKNQVVYRVRVRDAQGGERAGWVRCGGWALGMLVDKIEAKWDN